MLVPWRVQLPKETKPLCKTKHVQLPLSTSRLIISQTDMTFILDSFTPVDPEKKKNTQKFHQDPPGTSAKSDNIHVI